MITATFRLVGKLRLLLVCAGLMLLASACNKQLDVDSSRQADEEGHWTKYEDARSGLISLYGLFRAAIADNNAHWVWGELRQGDFRSVSRSDLKAVIDGNLNASFPLIQNVTNWRRFYAAINACNLFIERVDGCLADKRYTETYYKLDIAQARALRAFLYFYMSRIWGDVPLITVSNDGGNFESLPRTSQEKVLSFAEQELIAAAPRLPYLYSGPDPDQIYPANYYGFDEAEWSNALLTRLAAYGVLAHIAAWEGRYLDVAVYTEFIVNNAAKSKLSMATVSLPGSAGSFGNAISELFNAPDYRQLIGFSFIQQRGETTSEGHIEQLTLANTTSYAMSKQLPDIYVSKDSISKIFPNTDPYDIRFGIDVSSPARLPYTAYFENYDAEVPVFKKIRVVDGGVTSTGKYAVYNSAIVFTRLEEIKLLRAEALAVLGQSLASAQELNAVRSARNISSIDPAAPGVDLLNEIFAERRRELMGEGWRWYDLVRYNRLKRSNPQFNELLDRGGIYWPIAQEVLHRNPQLVQNAYWQ